MSPTFQAPPKWLVWALFVACFHGTFFHFRFGILTPGTLHDSVSISLRVWYRLCATCLTPAVSKVLLKSLSFMLYSYPFPSFMLASFMYLPVVKIVSGLLSSLQSDQLRYFLVSWAGIFLHIWCVWTCSGFILTDAHVEQSLASVSLFKLASESFWHDLTCIWSFLCCLVWQEVPGLSCTFPDPDLELTISSKCSFLLVKNGIWKPTWALRGAYCFGVGHTHTQFQILRFYHIGFIYPFYCFIVGVFWSKF